MNQFDIVVFHGSPRAHANEEILNMVERLTADTGTDYLTAFLEFADPSLEVVIESRAQTGPCEISILPVFLSRGSHVTRHIPEIAARQELRHRKLKIEIRPEFGHSIALYEALHFYTQNSDLKGSYHGRG